jgi:enterochelin esterase-like enzyme
MHGSDADHTQWTNNKLNAHWVLEQGLREGTLPPMLLVMPNGGEIANLNIFTEGRSYEWLILNELMPAVEKTFCTWNSRQGRAIGGISRGGFWAYLIAFRHPELFGAVGGHSAFFSAGNAPPAFNPLDLAKNKSFPANQQPRLWIDAGRNDYARPNIEVFQRSLAARKIDPGYRMFPIGEHNETYWAAHVSDYLEFYGDPCVPDWGDRRAAGDIRGDRRANPDSTCAGWQNRCPNDLDAHTNPPPPAVGNPRCDASRLP